MTCQKCNTPRFIKKSTIERFLGFVRISDSGCWNWIAFVRNSGYGMFMLNKKPLRSHRWMYEYYHGQIDPKLTIDHLCRNRKCCNPKHLEQVTQKENLLRGVGFSAINARKTHCHKGHEFTIENTYHVPNGRNCRKCRQQSMSEYTARQTRLEN